MKEIQRRSLKGNKNPAWKGGKKIKTCKICGNIFKIYPYRDTTAKYCSKKCQSKGKGLSISKAKLGHKVSESTRIKLSKILKRITPTGSESPLWKNGLTPIYNRLRNSLRYRIWRNKVYEKDYWTCQICKRKLKSGEIIAHHLTSFAFDIKNRFNINNGTTLCRSCHIKLHERTTTISYLS